MQQGRSPGAMQRYAPDAHADPEQGAQQVVTLPVNKNLIASRLNLTPETFSRVLHQLSDAGLLAVNGRDITLLDLDKVRAFGCG